MSYKNNTSIYGIFQGKKPPKEEGYLQKFYNNNGIKPVTVNMYTFMLSLKSFL